MISAHEKMMETIQFHQTNNAYHYALTQEGEKCQFLQFLINTSNFAWRKIPEEVTEEDKQQEATILLSKLCAIGYLIFHIKRPYETRVVILTDYMNAETGRSGKSLFIEFVTKFVETPPISCRNQDITHPFLWNDLSDKTRLVLLDDLQPDFNFENLFPFITGDWVINRKGQPIDIIPFRHSPKIILSTNYKIQGKGYSFDDRKWEIPFSDYYNANHNPIDDFGKYFFIDWTMDDWRHAYMLAVDCVQFYLNYGTMN